MPPFAERVCCDQQLGPGDRSGRSVECQLDLGPVLLGGGPQLVEPGGFGAGELLVGELCVRPAAPQTRRPVHQRGRVVGPAAGHGVPGPGDELLELARVGGRARHGEQITRGAGLQLICAEDAAQARHLTLQRVGRVRRAAPRPQHLRDPVRGHRRTPVYDQQGEQSALGR
ncbi:hypothetical protein PHK61_30985 [Actinomycetospora lutea]|nr:hypothetical protein [Actinomycetospora lutea]MDD7942847.1 hypothetical protein [Actinomycetospora lutea]